MAVRLQRAYEPAAAGAGFRVLVERLWPRGVRKEELDLDEWAKDVAPSPSLRKWFGHDPARWDGFRRRYLAELRRGAAARKLGEIAARAAREPVTLLFSAHDAEHNSAVVLKQALASRSRKRARPARKRVR